MKRGKPLKRTKGVRPEQRRFLIYCEGACTEDQYFKGLRTDLRSLPVAICLGGEHGEPKSLVRAAIDHQKRAPHSAGDRWTEYESLRAGHGQAEQRAQVLRQRATKGHADNPWTDVDRLVGLLRAARYGERPGSRERGNR